MTSLMTAGRRSFSFPAGSHVHTLSLMDFNRQAVGIMEESHLSPGKGIGSHRLTGDSLFFQLRNHPIHTLHLEGQMAQAICFRAQAKGMILHDKEFELAAPHLQIDLPVVALRPVVLSDDPKTELLMIKLQRSGFIPASVLSQALTYSILPSGYSKYARLFSLS